MRAFAVSLLTISSFTYAEAPPSRPIVLKAARLFDGKADATTSPGLVVVKGAKIVSVGTSASVPADAEVLDLGDATLLPGLMDAHTHLTSEMTDDWKQDELDFFKKSVPQRAIESTDHARRTLRAGFTTVRDVGSSDLIDIGLRNAIAEGKAIGPRMLVSVNAIGSRGGHCDPTAGYRPDLLKEPGTTDGVASGPYEMRSAVRYNTKHGADLIKLCSSGGVLSLADKVDSPQLTQEELNAAVDEAHALGRKAAAHAHGAEAAKRAVRAGIDSIEHGSFLDDEAFELMRKKGTYFVPTPLPCILQRLRDAKAPANIIQKAAAADGKALETLKRAIAKNARIAFGSDAAVCPHGTQLNQFEIFVRSGMKPLAAIRTATSVDAALIGVPDRGTLEGREAG